MRRIVLALALLFASAISSSAYSYGTTSVAGTATSIVGSNRGRSGLMICNSDASVTLYIAFDSSVTTANGVPLAAGKCYSISGPQSTYRGSVFGITAGSTVDVRYQDYGIGDTQ